MFNNNDFERYKNEGYRYEFGLGVDQDIVKAKKSYSNAGFCCELGLGVDKDIVKAKEFYEKVDLLGK